MRRLRARSLRGAPGYEPHSIRCPRCGYALELAPSRGKLASGWQCNGCDSIWRFQDGRLVMGRGEADQQ